MKKQQITLEKAFRLLQEKAPGKVCAEKDGSFWYYPDAKNGKCPYKETQNESEAPR